MNNETVNHPAHYAYAGIECIDAIEAATSDKTGIEAVCVANVIKYTWRYTKKNGVNDLEKAKWYLEKLITYLEEKEIPLNEECELGCEFCKYSKLTEYEYPCCACKFAVVHTDKEYKTRPNLCEMTGNDE